MYYKSLDSNTKNVSINKTSNQYKHSSEEESKFREIITKLKNKTLPKNNTNESKLNSETEQDTNLIINFFVPSEIVVSGFAQESNENSIEYRLDIESLKSCAADNLLNIIETQPNNTTNIYNIDELENKFNSYLSNMMISPGNAHSTWQIRYIDPAMKEQIDITLEKISSGNLTISLNTSNAEQHSIKILLNELNTRLIQKGWKINADNTGSNHLIQKVHQDYK
jgi:hypothetical protein